MSAEQNPDTGGAKAFPPAPGVAGVAGPSLRKGRGATSSLGGWRYRLFWVWLVLWFLSPAAGRAELVLTNFTPGNPLKIMAVGDSITDDCMFDGAWRQYLQPLLETNGYPFVFVGRQSSAPKVGFNQILHEGYCGSVIAAPGVYENEVYGYGPGDLYMQAVVADAFSNATPDLVLVLMGANDLGNGRDPWSVATNDMPAFLDMIFSNAPTAHVIVNKALTLQNAVTAPPVYGLFATNVPIYNAVLQQVINARRHAGQKVSLADMFSAVDYGTMFVSDHLHPNQLGLQAIAAEWLTRMELITARTDVINTVLVNSGADWTFSDTGVDLGSAWKEPGFDDSTWSRGAARLGYGDLSMTTTVSYGGVATNKQPTTYFRHQFVLPPNVEFTNLVLRLAQAHGSLVWLNGQEVWRTNLPAGPIGYTNFATKVVGLYAPQIYYSIPIDATKLQPGTNLLALELHQFSPYIASLGFDLELLGAGLPGYAPPLVINLVGSDVVVSWPLDGGADFTLFTNNQLSTTGWSALGDAAQTNGSSLVITQALDAGPLFFRLQKN